MVVDHGTIKSEQLNHCRAVVSEAPNAWIGTKCDFNAFRLGVVDAVQPAVAVGINTEVATDVAIKSRTPRVAGHDRFSVGSTVGRIRLHGNITKAAWIGRNLEILTGEALQRTRCTSNLSGCGRSASESSRVRASTVNTEIVGVGRLDRREKITVSSGDNVITPRGGVDGSSKVGFGVTVGLTGASWC